MIVAGRTVRLEAEAEDNDKDRQPSRSTTARGIGRCQW